MDQNLSSRILIDGRVLPYSGDPLVYVPFSSCGIVEIKGPPVAQNTQEIRFHIPPDRGVKDKGHPVHGLCHRLGVGQADHISDLARPWLALPGQESQVTSCSLIPLVTYILGRGKAGPE